MSLDRNSPDRELLGRLGIIGHPWHGVCRAGVLTLPNGTTKAYPQPAGGDANLLQVPGVAAVVRSPEDAAADEAAGLSWLNYAILSGSTCQLYSKPLGAGRWIYVDPAGDRWLVSTTLHDAIVSAIEGTTVTVTLQRFGVIGGTPATHTYTVAVPSLGQDGPLVYDPGFDDGTFLTTARIRCHLAAPHPQGSRAAFRLSASVDSTKRVTQWAWRPCGWIELQITGAGASASFALAVLKTRAETIGTMTAVDERVYTYLYQTVTTALADEGGAYPACGGEILEFTTTGDVFADVEGAEGGNVYRATNRAMTNGLLALTIESVIGASYIADGSLVLTTCHYTLTQDEVATHTLDVTKELDTRYTSIPGFGECVPNYSDLVSGSSRQFVVTVDQQISTTLRMEIRNNGVLVDAYDSGEHLAHVVSTHPSTGTVPANTSSSYATRDASTTYAGETWSDFGQWYERFEGVDSTAHGGEPGWRLQALLNMEIKATLLNGVPELSYWFSPVPYSNKVVGYQRTRRHKLSAVSVSSSSQHRIAGWTLLGDQAYASRHPVSGAVVSDTVPVCWV